MRHFGVVRTLSRSSDTHQTYHVHKLLCVTKPLPQMTLLTSFFPSSTLVTPTTNTTSRTTSTTSKNNPKPRAKPPKRRAAAVTPCFFPFLRPVQKETGEDGRFKRMPVSSKTGACRPHQFQPDTSALKAFFYFAQLQGEPAPSRSGAGSVTLRWSSNPVKKHTEDDTIKMNGWVTEVSYSAFDVATE